MLNRPLGTNVLSWKKEVCKYMQFYKYIPVSCRYSQIWRCWQTHRGTCLTIQNHRYGRENSFGMVSACEKYLRVKQYVFIVINKSKFHFGQVSSAVDHVQSGNTALQRAKKLQRSSRKWMCIAIIILLIIVVIIVVAVLKPWSKNGAQLHGCCSHHMGCIKM